MINSLPPLKEIIATYGLRTKKSLGQHFLLDFNITDKIVRYAGDLTNSTVIEIGPGPGGLTRSILRTNAKHVIAIEHDQRCVDALNDYLVPASNGKLTIIEQDALKIDPHTLADGPLCIIANLPYNIGTPLLFKWLEHIHHYTSLTLMFQKEVAERFGASLKTKAYGRSSVMAQAVSDVSLVYEVPASAFVPPPKVVSTVAQFIPKPTLPSTDEIHTLSQLCKWAFEQRRKTLRNSLKAHIDDPETLLKSVGLSPSTRPEALSVSDFLTLASAISHQKGR